MANIDRAQGFIPVKRLDGSPIPTLKFLIDSANDTAVYIYDLVGAEADGGLEVADSDEGVSLVGSVVQLQDSNGVIIGTPNSSVSTKYLPATTAGYAIVALALPDSVFRVQADTDTAPAATDVFSSADHRPGTGNTTTGKSGGELDSSDLAAQGGDQFRVIGKVDEPNNDWGEHVDLLVIPGQSWFMPIASAGL